MIPADETGGQAWDGRTERRHGIIMDQATLYKEVGELTGLVKAVLGKVEELKQSTDHQMKEVYAELEKVRRDMQEDKILRREDQETMDKRLQREIGRMEERVMSMRVAQLEKDQSQERRIAELETWQRAHDKAIEDAKAAKEKAEAEAEKSRQNSLGVKVRNTVITASASIITAGLIGWAVWSFASYMASLGKFPTP